MRSTGKKSTVNRPAFFENRPMSTALEARFAKTSRAVELAAAKLVKEGRLKYVGPQKGGHWQVLK